jgi:ABC-type multidrug transport system permease subunit
MKKAASIFSIFCGVSMLVVWGILLSTGQVVELQTEPFGPTFLLGAEFLTAISLLIGGFGLLNDRNWGLRAALAALGMLLYCTVFSSACLASKATSRPPAFSSSWPRWQPFFPQCSFLSLRKEALNENKYHIHR